MDAMSPFTRRFVALAILFLLAVSLVNLIVLPLAYGVRQSLGHLGDVRFERAQAEQVLARPSPPPPPPTPPGMTIVAANQSGATAQLAGRLRQAATAAGLTATVTRSGGAGPAVAVVDVELEGPETAVMSFVGGIESGSPLVRWRQWQLARRDKGVVALRARAVAAWVGQ